ncbi:MAG: molybdopterin-dependent oxidoreductase, partial [Chloroflexi bacterium]|nr:molybdopterin-dependent oxidoreductase [Chloroflexota bacterium]
SGVNPLAGVSNTQGTADMGCLPNFYPGYQRVSNATAQQKFEEAWGYPLGTTPGLTLTEVFPAIKAGKVKALYVVGHNPLLSHPDVSQVEAALDNIDFLVVQDIFLTETARLAHVVLPAATFAEKEGTFTNTERRVQQLNPVILPPGEAKPDWWITCQLAQRMGGWGFSFDSPSQIMEEIALLAPVYGGMTYPQLENGGRQWPCPTLNHPGTPIVERQGRFQFTPIEYRPVAEMTDADHPLILITGRSLWQFNAGNMTREVQGLNDLMGEAVVEINPQDAASLNLAEGELVSVVSRLGRVKAKAKLNAGLRSGTLFMAFHAPEVRANLLTQTTLDPKAETPALKTCAVSLEKN